MTKSFLLLAVMAAAVSGQHSVDPYNVVWMSPSADSSGSMPIGNGDIGLNVWVEQSGELLFYIAKSDAWSENVRLLKLGRVRVRLSPNPFTPGQPFKQTLNLRTGEILIQAGSEAKLSVWVDANHPVIRVEADTQSPVEIQAIYERWRDQTHVLEGDEVSSAYGLDGGPEPIRSLGDTIHLDGEDCVTWYHRNTRSSWPGIMKHQGVADVIASLTDPIGNRTFGVSMRGEGFRRLNPTTLRSKTPLQKQSLSLYALTAITDSSEEWVRQIQDVAGKTAAIKVEDRRASHEKYWADFWDRSYIRITGSPEAKSITQGYMLQRFLNACAGRGAYPIKANGSLFTVDAKIKDFSFDADYRRWGGQYSFQNTRLIYWPMLASGDSELMQPFFDMYRDSLLLATKRSKLYFNHEGAFFPESMYFWGAYGNSNYGWNREGNKPGYVEDMNIRNYFTSSLELLAIGLDYSAYWPQDRQFIRTLLGPLADNIILFYDQHFERDEGGTIRLNPSQSLATWHDVVNPLPDIAGLKYVLTRLLAEKVPLTKPAQTAARRILQQLPQLPLKATGRKKVLVAAERIFGESKNTENPELYAVFPFRLLGAGKSDVEIAVNTFEARKFKTSGSWSQDAIQAAYLGLADIARQYVTQNFTATSEQRFLAFWGSETNWLPDQTNGNVASMALQAMLVQAEGEKILVGPAWPKNWDVEFKLHAPHNTVLEGAFKAGKLENLKVTPDKRNSGIVRLDPQ